MSDAVHFGDGRRSVDFADPSTEQSSYLRPLFESGLLLLAIRYAESIWFGPGYYAQLDFHPFWIVILLAAMQYGVFGGVAAAGLACLLMDWPPRPIGLDIAQHYIDLAIQPLHWLVVALLLGSYRQMQIWRSNRLRRELARFQAISESLAEEVTRMDTALAHAELAIVTRSDETPDKSHPFETLLGLLHSSNSIDDLEKAFEAAAKVATALPAGLLIADTSGNLAPNSPDRFPDGIPLPLKKTSKVVSSIRSGPSSAVVPMSDLVSRDSRFLIAAGVHSGFVSDLVGAVILIAEDEASASLARPIAELLALAVSTALATEGQENGEESDNIRLLPTATK